jgi:hypothetical protein
MSCKLLPLAKTGHHFLTPPGVHWPPPSNLPTQLTLWILRLVGCIWSWALLERPLDVRPLDSFLAFHGTQSFNTEFTRALHLFLSWARPIQSTSCHPTSPRSILILSTHLHLSLSSGLFLSGFHTNNLHEFLFAPIRATWPSYSILFDLIILIILG